MFGWLAAHSPSLCRRAPHTVVSRRARRITPRALIEALPGLGSVLYLHAASNLATLDDLPQGLLAQCAFLPLLSAHWLIAVSVVTDDGPREWCECVDVCGRTRARWHLLPDTDYLAWDALTAACAAVSPPSDTQPWRPGCASVVSFHLREVAGLMLLEQDASPVLSQLGGRIANRIAHAESAVLIP
ncbi:hypothetical protein [Dyella nitratireducens]|uniref:Hemin transport protein n=1 Tax=Dyella nitratireducens TaxID=1849580 RepID=A0ABQ1FMM6_9GAMM|nr:hypothetical protein [Dyella nitratireducens]GGA22752.1 hypothetical protein GCM10010981_08710 [Dyella nitratireducens]GLQ44069.1 hypothetical protein GCM10007902_39190 [Dyella nitratireducens]